MRTTLPTVNNEFLSRILAALRALAAPGAQPVVRVVAFEDADFGNMRYGVHKKLVDDSLLGQDLYAAPPAARVPEEQNGRFVEVGWVCKDGFPALIGSRPCEPGTKLYAAAPEAKCAR